IGAFAIDDAGFQSVRVFFIGIADAFHTHQFFFGIDFNQRHAFGVAAQYGYFVHPGTHQRALIADQHHFVAIKYLYGTDQRAVTVIHHHGDNALGATALGREFGNLGALTVTTLRRGQNGATFFRYDQGDYALAIVQFDTAHTTGTTAHGTDIRLFETHRFTGVGQHQNILRTVGNGHTDQVIAFVQFTGNQAHGTRTAELIQRGFLHRTACGDHEYETVIAVFIHRQNGGDALAFAQVQPVHNRTAFGITAGLRNVVNGQPVHFAGIGKAQHGIVAVHHQHAFNKVFVFDAGRRLAFTTTLLRLVSIHRLGFGIATVRQS